MKAKSLALRLTLVLVIFLITGIGQTPPQALAAGNPPTADSQSTSTNEDNIGLSITLTGHDTEGDALEFSITGSPAHGTLGPIGLPSCSGVPSTCSATVTYTPSLNYNGPDSFTFKVRDSTPPPLFSTVDGTVSITVTPINDVPSFTSGGDRTVLEDAGAQTFSGWATAISPGPADEAAQTVDFIVTNNNNPLFSTQPAVSPTGTLTFTPAPNGNGVATVSVSLHDSGGTANGGVDTSPIQTFTISVTAVNDAPSFTKGADQTVLEEATAQTVTGWATAISPGPADEAAQTVSFTVTNDNNTLFSVQPAVSASGTLTFTPAANASGVAVVSVSAKDSGGTANGGSDTSAIQTFSITITGVNDPPSFTKGGDQTLLEDAPAQSVPNWATAISPGPASESAQTVSFNLTNTNNALFSVQPAVSSAGTLTFTLAPNANGSAVVTVTAQDNGGVANGGVDISASQTFNITVTAVNDAPSFTKGTDKTVLEDAVAQTFAGWATAISPGPADEAAQTVSFTVTNNNNTLFSAQPAVGPTGTLTYMPLANANGSATVSVSLHDSGGLANGGADTSPVQTFTITVTAVNDAPSFTKGADQTVLEDAPAQSVPNWATAISPGPNEASQSVDFIVGNNNTSLFSAQPAISPTGTLTYTPFPNANGSATVTVRVHDDGGTANGGVDISAAQTFIITITSVNDAPTDIQLSPTSVNENLPVGTVVGILAPVDVDLELPYTFSFVAGTGDTDNGKFTIDGNQLKTAAIFDYETKSSYSILVQVTDNGNPPLSSLQPKSFSIGVNNVNDAPVAKDDPYTIRQGNTLTVTVPGLLANDSDADGNSMTAVIKTDVSSGDLNLKEDGSFVYKPLPSYTGVMTFTYQARDTGGLFSNTATVQITVQDAESPTVHWIQPVTDGLTYDAVDQMITLKAEAVDNVSIQRVRFSRWDAEWKPNGRYVEIGIVYSTPYQIQLNPLDLNMGWNQIFVEAYDNMGNRSNVSYIWVYRNIKLYYQYLPMLFDTR